MTTNNSTVLYNLSLSNAKSYLFAALFIAGNIAFPQLCHLFPQGGLIVLPIYFFTLIASYKCGIKVGLLTAVLSPILNHLLFGMPSATVLPIILVKSSILAVTASIIARKKNEVTLMGVILAVVSYQFIGGLVEWCMTNSLYSALQDILLGYPGIVLQMFGGYAMLKYLLKK